MKNTLAAWIVAAGATFGFAAQAAETVLVFGGNRATGLEAVKAMVAKKDKVTVVVRPTSDTAELKALGVTTVVADVLQPAEVQKAFTSGKYTAVVSALGGKRGEPSPDFVGIKNITDAAKAASVKRMVIVTAIGVGDSNAMMPEALKKILQPTMIEKGKGEDYLVNSGLDYTIIRPGGLKNGPATGKAKMVDDHTAHSDINREDLGALVAASLTDKTTVRKIMHAVDPTLPSAEMH
jgi:uncharacterized protein YbjT (DUF2867 family)